MSGIDIRKEENINTWLYQINESGKAAVSIDCVIFGYQKNELKVLTIECNMPPYVGKKSLVGDLIQSHENMDQAASRILKDRVGLENIYLEQVHTFGKPDRHPLGRVISVAYVTIVNLEDYVFTKVLDRKPKWVPVCEIESMAFDHKTILNKCLKIIQSRIHTFPIAFELLAEKFSVVELQQVYESVLGRELDKRNFRRKLKKLPYIIDLKELQSNVNHRPARLFKFDFEKYQRHKMKDKINFNL